MTTARATIAARPPPARTQTSARLPIAKTARRTRVKQALTVVVRHRQLFHPEPVARCVAARTKVVTTRRIASRAFVRTTSARLPPVPMACRTAPKLGKTAAVVAPKVAPQARLARGLAIASLATARRIPLERTPRARPPPAQTVFKTALKRPLTAAAEIALVAV